MNHVNLALTSPQANCADVGFGCVFAGCLVNRGGMSFSQWNVDVSGFILGHLASVDGDNKAFGADKRFQGERTTTRVGAAVKWR